MSSVVHIDSNLVDENREENKRRSYLCTKNIMIAASLNDIVALKRFVTLPS